MVVGYLRSPLRPLLPLYPHPTPSVFLVLVQKTSTLDKKLNDRLFGTKKPKTAVGGKKKSATAAAPKCKVGPCKNGVCPIVFAKKTKSTNHKTKKSTKGGRRRPSKKDESSDDDSSSSEMDYSDSDSYTSDSDSGSDSGSDTDSGSDSDSDSGSDTDSGSDSGDYSDSDDDAAKRRKARLVKKKV